MLLGRISPRKKMHRAINTVSAAITTGCNRTAPSGGVAKSGRLFLLIFELEAMLVLFEEIAEIFGHVEKANPLFIVERDGEAA